MRVIVDRQIHTSLYSLIARYLRSCGTDPAILDSVDLLGLREVDRGNGVMELYSGTVEANPRWCYNVRKMRMLNMLNGSG